MSTSIATKDITAVPLSGGEEIRLRHLEQVVEDGLDAFVAVGRALAAIRDGKLYRATHKTFAAYVKDRFELSPSYAYRQMEAAEVAAIVSPIGNIQNEAQARELVGLDKDRAIEVYQRAVAETAGRPLTATALRTARNNASRSANSHMPRFSRPEPLPDFYDRKVREVETVITQLEKLHKDDRFRANRKQLAEHNRVTITVLIGKLAGVLDDLGVSLDEPLPFDERL